MTKLLTLAKRLDFECETDYFNYMIDSYINDRSQCQNLFKALTKEQKKEALIFINTMPEYLEVYKYYFNLL